MKLNRTLSLCLTLVVCAGLAIGGTLAYYTDQATVENTFNLSDGVDITLDEAVVEKLQGSDEWQPTGKRTEEGNTYNGIYPGAVLPKDPTVHVADNSDDTYVRVKVTVENGFNFMGVYTDGKWDPEGFFAQLINNNLGEGWELTDINILMSGPDRDTSDMEYTLTYTERLSAGESTPPAFTEIVFSPKFDKTSIETMVGKSFNVDVIAEAIQAATFNSAVEAFANYDGVAPDAPNTDWYDENATEYTLDSAEDLLGFAQKVNSGVNFKGKTVKLGADINLQNIEWTPIGYKANNNGGFGGTFDGQGHTISNLYVDVNDGAGLFGYVFATGTRPVVKNVKVENATITGTHYAGVIAAHTNGHITGCSVVNATISCADPAGKDGDKVGSIVGFAGSDVSFEISGNYAKNVTISANRDAGAIVGRIDAAKHTLSGNTFENVTVTHNGYETGANISNNEAGRIDNQ